MRRLIRSRVSTDVLLVASAVYVNVRDTRWADGFLAGVQDPKWAGGFVAGITLFHLGLRAVDWQHERWLRRHRR